MGVDVYYLVRRSSLGSDTGNSMMLCQRRLGKIRDRSSGLVDLWSVHEYMITSQWKMNVHPPLLGNSDSSRRGAVHAELVAFVKLPLDMVCKLLNSRAVDCR